MFLYPDPGWLFTASAATCPAKTDSLARDFVVTSIEKQELSKSSWICPEDAGERGGRWADQRRRRLCPGQGLGGHGGAVTWARGGDNLSLFAKKFLEMLSGCTLH